MTQLLCCRAGLCRIAASCLVVEIPHSLALAEAFLVSLQAAGLPRRETALAFRLIHYTVGFSLSGPRSAAEQRTRDATTRRELHAFLRSLLTDRFPALITLSGWERPGSGRAWKRTGGGRSGSSSRPAPGRCSRRVRCRVLSGTGIGWRCRRLSRWSRVWVLLRTPAAVYPRAWRLCGRVRSFSCADDGSRRPPGREGRRHSRFTGHELSRGKGKSHDLFSTAGRVRH